MKIEFSNKLRKRTIAFCDDELNYHINESGCATDYHDEILAQIEILFLLGETEPAEQYAFEYGNKVMGNPEQVKIQRAIYRLLNKYSMLKSV